MHGDSIQMTTEVYQKAVSETFQYQRQQISVCIPKELTSGFAATQLLAETKS